MTSLNFRLRSEYEEDGERECNLRSAARIMDWAGEEDLMLAVDDQRSPVESNVSGVSGTDDRHENEQS